MPIHDQSYRRRQARAPLRAFRAAPVATLALKQVVARRALGGILALSLVPFVIAAGALYLLNRVPEVAQLPRLSVMFGIFMRIQMVFALLMTVWAGTSLVADDFRSGALLVYFSRPLTRADYVLGKLGVLALLNAAVIAVPTLALWGLAVAFDSHDLVARGLAFLAVPIVVQSIVVSLVLSLLAFGAGALTRNGALGGLLLVGSVVVFDAAAAVAPTGARAALRLLSLPQLVLALEGTLFSLPADPERLHWAVALASLVVLGAAAAAVLWRRLQAVEVV
jgi:ABC-2 type transport system permease protein